MIGDGSMPIDEEGFQKILEDRDATITLLEDLKIAARQLLDALEHIHKDENDYRNFYEGWVDHKLVDMLDYLTTEHKSSPQESPATESTKGSPSPGTT